MDAETISAMEDQELTILIGNARRLIISGSVAQKAAAAALLPAVEAELAERSTVKLAKKAEALAARRASKTKPAALAAG